VIKVVPEEREGTWFLDGFPENPNAIDVLCGKGTKANAAKKQRICDSDKALDDGFTAEWDTEALRRAFEH
jgi:hypothetical protein